MQQNFDYTRLRQRISERYDSQENFAQAVGFSPVTLQAKLNNTDDFTQSEINEARVLLGIPDKEVTEFFFTIR